VVSDYRKDRNGLSHRLAPDTFDNVSSEDEWPADPPARLVSLAFLTGAIRRSKSFCYMMAILGLLIGCAIYKEFPTPYKASTSVLLTYGPYEAGQGANLDNQAIAQTRTVATLAMDKLGLHQNPSSFLAMYKVSTVSSRMLLITFAAATPNDALRGANAVAMEFLQFRAAALNRAQEQVSASLNEQVSQAEQNVSSIKEQISQASAQASSAEQQSQLASLQAQLASATTTLTNLQQSLSGNAATNEPATAAAVKNSQIIDAAGLLPRSHLRSLVLYPGAGLVAGAVVGMVIVVIRAIMSDRLRRRDDIADALGAPVKVSTGSLRRNWRLLISPGRRAARQAGIRRVVAHLGNVMPENAGSPPAMAVVAVDDPESAAVPLLSLATSCAQRGQRVLLADLADGACAARILGVRKPGVTIVNDQDHELVVALPEWDDVAPTGPLGLRPAKDGPSDFTNAVAAACAEADVLLTLVTLNPWFGGDHLGSWATDAVAVITAGRSSWSRINAVGEMIRLSGTRLVSAVLMRPDRTDESIGVPIEHRPATEAASNDPTSNAHAATITPDDTQGGWILMTADDPGR
jgi:capsular polysaccharide biosynthesis protein